MVATLSFWRRRQTLSFAVASAWLCENLLNIARYMSDARSQALPLVGGGEHDWTNIFTRWGLLASDVRIGRFVRGLGWTGLLLLAAWIGLRWWRRERLEEPSAAQPRR